jgi:hypothetical protein
MAPELRDLLADEGGLLPPAVRDSAPKEAGLVSPFGHPPSCPELPGPVTAARFGFLAGGFQVPNFGNTIRGVPRRVVAARFQFLGGRAREDL